MKFIKELYSLRESSGLIYGVLVANERGEDLDDLDIHLFSTEEKRTAFLNKLAQDQGYADIEAAWDDEDAMNDRLVHVFERSLDTN